MSKNSSAKSRFIKALVLSSYVAGLVPNNASAVDIAYKCEAIFDHLEDGPFQIETKKVPSIWRSLLKLSFAERTAALEFNKKLDQLRFELTKDKADLAITIKKLKTLTESEVKTGHQKKLISDYLTAAEALIEKTQRSVEAKTLNEIVVNEYQKIVQESIVLDSRMKTAASELARMFKATPNRFKRDYSQTRFDAELNELRKSKSVEEHDAKLEVIKEALTKEYSEFMANEKLRQEKEKRFDLAVTENSSGILSEYLNLVDSLGIESIKQKMESKSTQILHLMDSSPDFKRFVYFEMQAARRLVKSEHNETLNLLRMRTMNNEAILQEAIQNFDKNPSVAAKRLNAVTGLRRHIRLLSKGPVFAKTALKDSLRKLPSRMQERLLSDAMSNNDLAMVILGSAVSVPALAPKPMVRPTKPVRPAKLETNRRGYKPYSKYENNNRKQKNSSNKSRYEQAKVQFARDVQKFKSQSAKYRESVEVAKTIEARRRSSREALFAYIIEKYPEVIPAKTASGMTREQVIAISKQSQRQIIGRRLQRAQPKWRDGYSQRFAGSDRYYNDRVYESSYDSSMDWLMMAYTGNPMWIISPTIAKFQLFMDILGGHDIRTGYGSGAHMIENGFSSFADMPVDRDRASGNLKNYAELSPEDIAAIRQSYFDNQKQDADVSLGGLTGKDLRDNQEIGNRLDYNRVLDQVEQERGLNDPEIRDPEATDPNEVQDEWSKFTAEADADWVDSKAEELELKIEEVEGESGSES